MMVPTMTRLTILIALSVRLFTFAEEGADVTPPTSQPRMSVAPGVPNGANSSSDSSSGSAPRPGHFALHPARSSGTRNLLRHDGHSSLAMAGTLGTVGVRVISQRDIVTFPMPKVEGSGRF